MVNSDEKITVVDLNC